MPTVFKISLYKMTSSLSPCKDSGEHGNAKDTGDSIGQLKSERKRQVFRARTFLQIFDISYKGVMRDIRHQL
jgi:hypothetical protein